MQCNAMQMQCNAAQRNATQCNAMQCSRIQYTAIEYDTIQYNSLGWNHITRKHFAQAACSTARSPSPLGGTRDVLEDGTSSFFIWQSKAGPNATCCMLLTSCVAPDKSQIKSSSIPQSEHKAQPWWAQEMHRRVEGRSVSLRLLSLRLQQSDLYAYIKNLCGARNVRQCDASCVGSAWGLCNTI